MTVKSLNTENKIKLLSFDIDNTLIDFHTYKSNFKKIWKKYQDQNDVILTYNTGRLIDDVLDLIEKGVLPEPDFIISGVGTHIYNFKKGAVEKEFNDVLDDGWNLTAVENIIQNIAHPISDQPSKFQHSYKRSYFFHNATTELIESIEQDFVDANMDVNIVYSGNKFLDVLPKWANKGNALQWLLKRLDLKSNQVLVAGDSGNDSAMFDLKDVFGIVVANAHDELYIYTKHKKVYHSEREKGDGIIEGLIFYEILPEEALEDTKIDHSDDFFIKKEIESIALEDII